MKIIAESAYNHQGLLSEVLNLMRAAADSEADYFTVQIMDPESFSDKEYSKHQLYMDHNISFDEWKNVFEESAASGLQIIPCALDERSLNFVWEEGYRFIKLHATDLTNPSMLGIIQQNPDVRVILETQAATNFEIRFALGYIGDQVDAILTGYSNYPTELEDLNLDSLDFLAEEYGKPVGLADHSPTVTDIPLMALAKGCKYLEKHITLTRNNRHFDWQVSLYPEEFKILTSKVRLYEKALGHGVKHPVKNEKPHRSVLYKKVMPDGSLKRADNAADYIQHTISGFDKSVVAVAVIARLKSKRLPKKILENIGSESLIEALYRSIGRAGTATSVQVATSDLPEDDALVNHCEALGIPVFRGHAVSVIDRMLDLAWERKAGIILRVTGDNPFTDPHLIDEMVRMVLSYDLDYAKVNNAPFGMSAEVFSTNYLWNLYVGMENPMVSEYLTWFVLNDESARKGSIDLVHPFGDLSFKNLSVDYLQDLEDARKVLACTGSESVSGSRTKEVLKCCADILRDKEDALMKLPEGKRMYLSEYISGWKNADYVVRKEFEVEA